MLLFVDYEVPHYDLFAGSRTNFMYLNLLVQMGLEVKLLPADFRRVEPYSSELNHLGIETLDGEWFQANWENWLRENGQAIDFVFLHKPDPVTHTGLGDALFGTPNLLGRNIDRGHIGAGLGQRDGKGAPTAAAFKKAAKTAKKRKK